jgi:hypothetical protein
MCVVEGNEYRIRRKDDNTARNKDIIKTACLTSKDSPRIGFLHTLANRKKRLNGAVLRMRPEKPRPLVTADDPSLLKGSERRV